VTSIGDHAFDFTLKEISVAEDNESYVAQGGILFTKDMKTLVSYPSAKPGETYIIPDGVTSIGDSAFFWCNDLRELTADIKFA
jgi:hypothetical protein